jgi:hypothetical protein
MRSSAQGEAIALATGSPWTHVGILFREKGAWVVYEAVGPVKATPLGDWIAQGEGGAHVAKRLTGDRAPDRAAVGKLKAAAERFMGLPYDWKFLWDDERIYCSELVWKMYRDALGVEIGALQKLREFDLTDPAVKAKMRERYGKNIPLDERVISPGSMFDSSLLQTVPATIAPPHQ